MWYCSEGFDNQGKDYDGDGVLRDWWQPQTEKKYVFFSLYHSFVGEDRF
jgi:predicted metalloendopeptidase